VFLLNDCFQPKYEQTPLLGICTLTPLTFNEPLDLKEPPCRNSKKRFYLPFLTSYFFACKAGKTLFLNGYPAMIKGDSLNQSEGSNLKRNELDVWIGTDERIRLEYAGFRIIHSGRHLLINLFRRVDDHQTLYFLVPPTNPVMRDTTVKVNAIPLFYDELLFSMKKLHRSFKDK
jgi:hypothetical protein